jgi:hypothetical protein
MAANILAAFPYANLTPVAILPGQPRLDRRKNKGPINQPVSNSMGARCEEGRGI